MIRIKEKNRAYFLLGCDVCGALAALPLGYQLRMKILQWMGDYVQALLHPFLYSLRDYIWFYLVALPVILLFFSSNTRWKPVYQWRDLPEQVLIVLEQLAVIAFTIGFTSFMFKLDVSRSLIMAYLAILFTFMAGVRLAMLAFFRVHGARNGQRHIVIVGNDAKIKEIGEKIASYADLGFSVSGYVTDLPAGERPADLVVLGSTNDFQRILETQVVDEVVCIGSERKDLEIFEKIAPLCEEQGIVTRLSLDFFPRSISRTSLDFIEDQPFLAFSPVPQQVLGLMVKRFLDILGGLVGLVLSLPLFIVVPVRIKLTSRGPVVYRQKRCGLYGRHFTIYKFRSMVDGAEDILWEIKHLSEMNGPVFKMRHDPRVTPLGRFLRKTSIDELPQFYNVLRGDMSLVGPRAPLPEEVSEYTRWQRRRLSVKPGLTCLWQIAGRNEIDFHEWMKLDLKYIDNWSLWLDLKILLLTVPTVLLCRGAR